MAYSMIIFCSVYYIAIFWMQEKINIINIKKFIRKTIPIALCTILAVGTAMIIFIPTLELLSEITKVNSQFINTTNLDLLSIINNFTNKFEFKDFRKFTNTLNKKSESKDNTSNQKSESKAEVLKKKLPQRLKMMRRKTQLIKS